MSKVLYNGHLISYSEYFEYRRRREALNDLFGKHIISSIGFDQDEMILGILELHAGGSIDCDLTYGYGGFYNGHVPQPKIKMDLDPKTPAGVIKARSTEIPLKSKRMRSIMFDPPFLAGGGKENSQMAKRYGCMSHPRVLNDFYLASCREISRVLKTGGILVFKCQDFVHGRQNQWSHCEVKDIAESCGLRAIDLFVLLAKNRPIPHNFKHQNHARKFHCYFWVFKKRRASCHNSSSS